MATIKKPILTAPRPKTAVKDVDTRVCVEDIYTKIGEVSSAQTSQTVCYSGFVPGSDLDISYGGGSYYIVGGDTPDARYTTAPFDVSTVKIDVSLNHGHEDWPNYVFVEERDSGDLLQLNLPVADQYATTEYHVTWSDPSVRIGAYQCCAGTTCLSLSVTLKG